MYRRILMLAVLFALVGAMAFAGEAKKTDADGTKVPELQQPEVTWHKKVAEAMNEASIEGAEKLVLMYVIKTGG